MLRRARHAIKLILFNRMFSFDALASAICSEEDQFRAEIPPANSESLCRPPPRTFLGARFEQNCWTLKSMKEFTLLRMLGFTDADNRQSAVSKQLSKPVSANKVSEQKIIKFTPHSLVGNLWQRGIPRKFSRLGAVLASSASEASEESLSV